MPYTGDGHQFSIRIPKDTWKRIEKLFEKRSQSHLSKNDKILTMLNERLELGNLREEAEKRRYLDRRQEDQGGNGDGKERRQSERRSGRFLLSPNE